MHEIKDGVWLAGGVLLPAYFVGAIPVGYLFGRCKGLDIRQQGSGNIGATNVWRILGKGWGIVTFVLDFAKAPVAISLTSGWIPGAAGNVIPCVSWAAGAAILAFLGAVLGHNYPIWLGFKGGKGIATSAGGLVWLMPKAFLVVLSVWIAVFAASRYVSLASILAATALPVGCWIFYSKDPIFLIFSCLLGVLAVWRHRSNIQRLRQGTEHRWTRSQREADMKTGGGS